MSKTYVVTGQHPVFGRNPGDTLDMGGVSAEQLARLVARGSIKAVTKPAPIKSKEQDNGEDRL